MWKNFTVDPPSPTLPPKLNETWGGKTNGEICENGWLRLHLQTEIGNLSEFKLPYKVSLYSRRDGQKCIFWPQFPFISPSGSLFPTFYPIFLTLWFSLWFWLCRPFQRHHTRGSKPYFRNHHGCKRTAFSEANSSVDYSQHTKPSLICQVLPPRPGVESRHSLVGSLGPAVSLVYSSLPGLLLFLCSME